MIDDDGPRLPYVCAECGAELMLTPSGHRFCADPTCTEGFGADTAISQQNASRRSERTQWRRISAFTAAVTADKRGKCN